MARNKPSFKLALPGHDKTIELLTESSSLEYSRTNPARLVGVVASSNEEQRLDLYKFIRGYRGSRCADYGLIIPSVPLLVKDYKFRSRVVHTGGKMLLSGAAAQRTLTKIAQNWQDVFSIKKLEKLAATGRKKKIKSFPTKPLDEKTKNLPFIIESKNFFNYYHFVTETLIYLQMYKDYDLQGKIIFISGNKDKAKPFIDATIKDFYPELLEKISLKRGQHSEKSAIIPYNANFLYHISPLVPDIEQETGFHGSEKNGTLRPVTINNYKHIYNTSRDSYIDRHRENALEKAVYTRSVNRVYLGRKPGQGNPRNIAGEDKLKEMLDRYGFQEVYFEDLSPKEQVGICHQADILLSAHGAGFANMMYGKPGAYFIELSHLLAARHRFGDFNMHAAASGVNYIHVFVDDANEGVPEDSMSAKEMLSGFSIADTAIDRIEGMIAMITDIPAYRSFLRRMSDARSNGNLDAVFADLKENPQYELGCPKVCSIAAEAYMQAGDGDAAITYLEKALQIAPYRRDLQVRLIEIASTMNREDVAEAARQLNQRYRTLAWMRWLRDTSGGVIIQEPKKK